MGVSSTNGFKLRVGFALLEAYRAGFSISSQANSDFIWASQIVPDQRILLVILGHLCQETLVQMLFVLILDQC
jgi:hypothetical protein